MVLAESKTISFDDFITWLPERSALRYWQDDYAIKQIAYQALGIQEYWIVDYLGLGGRNFVGYPKQPTISVYYLVDGEYDLHQFRSNELILSPTFPDLELSIDLVEK